jgi:hypothetical protein
MLTLEGVKCGHVGGNTFHVGCLERGVERLWTPRKGLTLGLTFAPDFIRSRILPTPRGGEMLTLGGHMLTLGGHMLGKYKTYVRHFHGYR